MRVRNGFVAGGLAALLALGAVACQVENGDIGDPLQDDDLFEDTFDNDLDE